MPWLALAPGHMDERMRGPRKATGEPTRGVAPGSGVAAEDLLQAVGSSALAGSRSAVELPVESFGTAAAEEVRAQASLLVRSAACWLLVASLLELLL